MAAVAAVVLAPLHTLGCWMLLALNFWRPKCAAGDAAARVCGHPQAQGGPHQE